MDLHAEARGLRFQFPHSGRDSALTRRLLAGRLSWPKALTPIVRGGVMLDIGANVGTSAIGAVALGGARRVYSAEPEPENFRCLVANIAVNRLSAAIVPSNIAIAETSGTGFLKHSEKMTNHRLGAPSVTAIPVRTLTVDAWVEDAAIDLRAVTLVKVDVQGYEGRVLQGASETLAAKMPWLVEISPRHLTASGMDVPAFIALLAEHFTNALDLDDVGAEPMTMEQTAAFIRDLDERRRYTNLLLR
jgi:FkbM family methyltransferase